MVSAPTDQKPDSPSTTRCVGRTSLAPPDCRALHPSVGSYQPISGLEVAAGLPGRLSVSAATSSSRARTIALSSGLPVLGQCGLYVPHHRPREATFTKAHGWTLLATTVSSIFFWIPPVSLVDPAVQSTSLSRRLIDQSIPPFNRLIYPAVQSTNLSRRSIYPTVQFTNLSRRSIDQSIPPFNRPIYPTVQSANLSHRSIDIIQWTTVDIQSDVLNVSRYRSHVSLSLERPRHTIDGQSSTTYQCHSSNWPRD